MHQRLLFCIVWNSIYGSYLADAEKKIHHFPKDGKWWILLYLYLNVYSTANLDFYSKLSLCFGRIARFI